MSKSSLYDALPSDRSVRLLQLHPGRDDELLSCSLQVYDDYATVPEYHALSYCWGDPSLRADVVCNGRVHTVPRSLYAALCQLRTKQCLIVWADAICIDQDNVSERNQQVSIMANIYGHASSVFIWIPPEDVRPGEVIPMIRALAGRVHEACGGESSLDSWLRSVPFDDDKGSWLSDAHAINPTDFPIAAWRSLWQFYQAPWFFRVWVIQEVRQGSEVSLLCGSSEIEWNLVALTASWIWFMTTQDSTFHWKREFFPVYDGFVNANLMWDQTLSTRREAPFLSVLHLTRAFQSTDPRDKVFAMLHHRIIREVSDEHGVILERFSHPRPDSETDTHLGLQADYNVSVYEVYHDVALQSMQQYNSLEVLCYAWQTARYSTSWPSWVPRWDIPNNQSVPVLLPFLYDAARGLDPEYHINTAKDTLTVRGLRMGPITETSFVVRYPTLATADRDSVVKERLMDLATFITQDRWQSDLSSDRRATRSHHDQEAYFASFASHFLRILEGQNNDCYVSLYSVWCECCERYVSAWEGEAAAEPCSFYHCSICDFGDFDLCMSCYDKGSRCKDASHTLQKLVIPSLWLPHSAEIRSTLREHAAKGHQGAFHRTLSLSCRRTAFFSMGESRRSGTASLTVEPGDEVVVLFGCRVPSILRRCGSAYRLVSDCYIPGLMDGEAVRMWTNGDLEAEKFEIR